MGSTTVRYVQKYVEELVSTFLGSYLLGVFVKTGQLSLGGVWCKYIT